MNHIAAELLDGRLIVNARTGSPQGADEPLSADNVLTLRALHMALAEALLKQAAALGDGKGPPVNISTVPSSGATPSIAVNVQAAPAFDLVPERDEKGRITKVVRVASSPAPGGDLRGGIEKRPSGRR